MESSIERLTNNFYQWEQMGRGWNVYDIPVDLEPPFVPFFFHTAPSPFVIDDGRRPTLVSKVADIFKGSSQPPVMEKEESEPVEPFPFTNDSPLYAYSIALPKGQKVKVAEMEQLLLMLSYCQCQISFEIIASHSKIRLQFVCREPDTFQVQNQLKSYFPNCVLNDVSEEKYNIIPDGKNACSIDYGLADEFMRPLYSENSFDLDPYTGLFGILENIAEGQHAVIQILFKGAVNPWSESIIRSVTDRTGGAFFLDAPEMVPLAKEKIASPLYGVVIRTIGCAETVDIAEGIALNIGNAMIRFSTSPGNKLIPLTIAGYDVQDFYEDIMLRQSHRLGMLLNTQELATLVHLPSPSVVSQKLERDTRKTKAAPAITEGYDFVLGINQHQGKEKEVTLASSQRLKHMHIIGATGTGKSTLILNLIMQDIQAGRGVAVLDPHGDLIESILARITNERIDDVVLIDPADSDFPVGFNILSAHAEIEKDILSSDLVAVFRRLSTSWGDQMNSVFANAILAFVESEHGGTLIDLRRFLIEKPFRESFLKTVTDPNIVYYWQKEFPLLKSSSIGPILTRLDSFLRPKLIRNMVAQKKGVNFDEVINSGKILLVKVSQGLIGAENSYLLGTIIVSKLHQAAMARQAKDKTKRNDFYCYIDEFQHFITPSMASILSGARKYHLGLILAHQDMQQLVMHDSELASSVLSNAGTRICFRVGDADAKKFEDGFSFFEAKDLQNQGVGEAIARVDRPEFDFTLRTIPLLEIDASLSEDLKNKVIGISRFKYGMAKEEVEATMEFLREEKMEVVVAEPRSPSMVVEEKIIAIPPITTPVQEIKPAIIKDSSFVTDQVKKKEESQHRYLQTLIKRMAESRGYKATLEEPTPDGKGRVDVGLLRNGKRIACEISVTTTEAWETHNIEKCLAAGYESVIVCSTDKRNLERINNLAKEILDETSFSKLLTLEPDALFLHLDQQVAQESNKEERIKGYRVKVEYNAVSPEIAQQKKESILKAVTESMRKRKG
jgi:hypothetical protein